MSAPAFHLLDRAETRGSHEEERHALAGAVQLMDEHARPGHIALAHARVCAEFAEWMAPRGGLTAADPASVVGFLHKYGNSHGRTRLEDGSVVSAGETIKFARKGIADKLDYLLGEEHNPARSKIVKQYEHAWARRNASAGIESAGAVPMARDKRVRLIEHARLQADEAWGTCDRSRDVCVRPALEAARNYTLLSFLHNTGHRGGESGSKLRWRDFTTDDGQLQGSLLGAKMKQTARGPPVTLDRGEDDGSEAFSRAHSQFKDKLVQCGQNTAPGALVFALWDSKHRVYGNAVADGRKEKPLDAGFLTRLIKKTLESAPGLEFQGETSHSFRRGCIIGWQAEGVSPEEVMRRTGVTQEQTLRGYANVARPTFVDRRAQNEARKRTREGSASAPLPAMNLAPAQADPGAPGPTPP